MRFQPDEIDLLHNALDEMLTRIKERDPIDAHKMASELVLATQPLEASIEGMHCITELALDFVIDGIPPLYKSTAIVAGTPDLRVVTSEKEE